jgi:hypothetical protein
MRNRCRAYSPPEVCLCSDRRLRDVSSGLQWKDGRLAFPSINLTLHEGPVRGHAAVGLDDLSYDVDLRAESVDLSGYFLGPSRDGDTSVCRESADSGGKA